MNPQRTSIQACKTKHARSTANNAAILSLAACLLSVTTLSLAQTPPIAAYNFNEASGTTLSDASGNNHTGTLTNGPTWSTGLHGGGLTFDGQNDYVTVPPSSLLNITGNQLSISAWVYPTASSGARVIAGKPASATSHSSPYYAYSLFTSGNQPHFYLRAGSSSRELSNAQPLPVNTWSHVSAVYDGVSMRLYVNGAQVNSRSASGNVASFATPLLIGVNGGKSEPWLGRIDDVRVSNTALTPAQVQAEMNTPVGPGSPDVIAPTVAMTAPSQNATVGGSVVVSASAADNVGVVGVRFLLDGVALGNEDISTPFGISWNTALTTNGNHTVAAVARDAAGNTATAVAVNIVVSNGGSDTTAPSAPTNLARGAVTTSSISLSWTASSDNVGVAGYRIFRNSQQVGSSSTTAFTDTGLAANTSYTYTVNAYDAAGNTSPTSASLVATTSSAADVTPPSTPTGLNSSGVTASQVTVSWQASSDNVGVTGYRVYRNGASVGTTTATSFTNTGLSASTSYTYTVAAFDAAGNNSPQSNSLVVTTSSATDVTPPSVPANLTSSGVTSSQVTLSWQASTDNVGVAGYRVYRNSSLVATTGTTANHTDTGLTANTTYSYTVSAFDAAGNSSLQSSARSVTTSATSGRNYSTNFDTNENPLSEGGAWHRANNRWTNVQVVNGVAFGTNGVTNSYDDSYSLLSGFGPDQSAEAVIYRNQSLSPGSTHEVELLLRASDDANNARGYEVLFSYTSGVQVVRWNGAFGDFTVLGVSDGGYLGRHLVTGDVVKASMIGNTITVYINNVLMGRAYDSAITSGQPGISFFIRPDGSQQMLGLTSYTVSSP